MPRHLVAFSTPTAAGKPYSRAMTAPWVISPPTSVTRLLIDTRLRNVCLTGMSFDCSTMLRDAHKEHPGAFERWGPTINWPL